MSYSEALKFAEGAERARDLAWGSFMRRRR